LEKIMIENFTLQQKYDRLFSFLRAFPLEARPCENAETANLLIVAKENAENPTHILYRPRAGAESESEGRPMAVFALSSLWFGGHSNPLVRALPDEITFSLTEEPQLCALSQLIIAEETVSRCGGGFIRTRLSEIIVVYAIRRAIANGTVNAGLLAGLAHPDLHPCLVALHDDPARQWRLEDLSQLSAMSRSRFIRVFTETVGRPPLSYLTGWRLTLGRVLLMQGISVKVAADRVGFGSASAFSRAFSRQFGYAPSKMTMV
jgi:AraC-like DNA-binding protein